MNVMSLRNAGLLVVFAACAAAATLIWATSGHAAKAAGSCPSVPAGSAVGYTAAGPVSSASGSTVARPVRKRLAHAKRHAATAPGQMPPFIVKHAADPACVPTPGAPTAGGAPTPAP
jgi:hypothetical protein